MDKHFCFAFFAAATSQSLKVAFMIALWKIFIQMKQFRATPTSTTERFSQTLSQLILIW
jgi:hypothetical protein